MSDLSVALWAAVDRLTRPDRVRLERDSGRGEWLELPPLLDQLAEAVQAGQGGSGRGKQGSRPPCDVTALSLLIDITATIRDALRSHRVKRDLHDTGRDLRALASHLLTVADDDETGWWVEQCRTWAGAIRATISNDQDRPWHLHGLPCPDCAATTIPGTDETGAATRRPAVTVTWARGYVRAVQCGMCGWIAFRGGELDTYAQTLIDNAGIKSSEVSGRRIVA